MEKDRKYIKWEGSLKELVDAYPKRKERENIWVEFVCEKCNSTSSKNMQRMVSINEDAFVCANCLKARKKLETYGTVENYRKLKRERYEATCMERYGTKNPPQKSRRKKTKEELKRAQEKCIQTRIKKYGSLEEYNKQRNAKVKATVLERYGVDSIAKLDSVKTKKAQTCIKKYGSISYLGSKENREKLSQICQSYGVNNISQIPEIQKKKEETTYKHFGVKYPAQSPTVKEKYRNNNLLKYSVEYPAKLQEVKDKAKQTCLERYGGVSSSQRNMSAFTKNIVNSKDNFVSFLKTCNSFREVSNKLNIADSTVRRYVEKYECENFCEIYISSEEKDFRQFVLELFPGEETIYNCRDIIYPHELDVYLPKLNLAFEYNGAYWHSNAFLRKDYHISKTLKCRNKSIRLIHVFGNNWVSNKEAEKEKIRKALTNDFSQTTESIIEIDPSYEYVNPKLFKLVERREPTPIFIFNNTFLENNEEIKLYDCGREVYRRIDK